MASTFWVSEKELDEDQSQAVQKMGEDDSFLVTGPAGSGKTNILLLRAKWFAIKGISDIKIIVFTASLKNFIVAGCEQYGISTDIPVTCVRFFQDLLREYGVGFELTGNFEADREMLSGKAKSLLDTHGIENTYDALLVDECQDLMDTELLVLRRLTKRLILVSDTRQSIYRTTHTPGLLENLVNKNCISLKYHYRSGLKLCLVADGILKDSINFFPVHKHCKYDESAKPSSVSITEYPTFSAQVEAILSKLSSQLDLYPDEYIGVLFPKREQQQVFAEALESLTSTIDVKRIIVETMHGAKGLEFRSVHIAGCEALSRMGPTQKRLTYTSILRGKTAVAFYHTGGIPGYLDSAVAKLEPPKANPSLSELFSSK